MSSGCLKTVMAEQERGRVQLVCIRVTIFQDLSKLTQDNGSSSLYPSSHSVSKRPFVFILVSFFLADYRNLELIPTFLRWFLNATTTKELLETTRLGKSPITEYTETCTFNEQYNTFLLFSFIVGPQSKQC